MTEQHDCPNTNGVCWCFNEGIRIGSQNERALILDTIKEQRELDINEGICIGVESVFEKGEYFVSIDASQNPSESTCWGYKNKRLRALLAGKERDGQNGGGETVLQEVKRLLQVGSQPSVGSTPSVVSPETSKDEFDEFWNQPDCKHNELF